MPKILSDRSPYAVIMHNSMYLNLEGYFSPNTNLTFCEVKFKPFGHPFLWDGFLLPLLIIHLLTVPEFTSPPVISSSDLKGFYLFVWMGFFFSIIEKSESILLLLFKK